MTLYRTSDQSVVWQKSIPSYYSVHISEDTRYLFLIEDTLHIFDTTPGALLHNLALPFDNIYKLILSPDHSTIACSNFDGEVALIKPNKNPSVLTKKLSDSAFFKLSFSADSTKVLCSSNTNKEDNIFDQTGTTYVFDLEGNELFSSTIKR